MRTTALAALGAAVLALAACSADPQPKFEPTPTSTTTSSSSSPSQEPQSAEDFIREWVDADTAMQNSGDTAEYLAMSRGCSPCRDFAHRVRATYERGGSITTKGWEVLKVTPGGTDQFRIRVDSQPATVIPRRGAPKRAYRGGLAIYQVTLKRSDGGWHVLDLIQVSS